MRSPTFSSRNRDGDAFQFAKLDDIEVAHTHALMRSNGECSGRDNVRQRVMQSDGHGYHTSGVHNPRSILRPHDTVTDA